MLSYGKDHGQEVRLSYENEGIRLLRLYSSLFFHCFYPYFVILIVIVNYIWVNTNGEMNAQQISRKIVSAVFCPFSA